MKYLIILIDGASDLPVSQLGGKTPLEYANLPNIAMLSKGGTVGLCKTVPDGMKPGSDVANMSVLGIDPAEFYTGRSPLEAASLGIELSDSDLCFRLNLVIVENGIMKDYSGDDISTEDARPLLELLQSELGGDEISFYAGTQYRHIMVWHKPTEHDDIWTPPHNISGQSIAEHIPSGRIGEITAKANKILADAGYSQSIWLWGSGVRPALPNFYDTHGKRGCIISAVDLLKGIGNLSGMAVPIIDGATGFLDTNFSGKAEEAIRFLKEDGDFVYIHLEAPDECGHRGLIEGKVKALELIDELVLEPILKAFEGEELRVLITPDHATPLATMTHSSEPVPFLLYSGEKPAEYTEAGAKSTGIYIEKGHELIKELFI